MTEPRSHAAERAEILSEVLERVLFDLRRGGVDDAARESLERALAEIAAWGTSSGAGAPHLAHLERATGAVDSARAALAAGSSRARELDVGRSRLEASVAEVAASLRRARAATIDLLVGAQDAELRAGGRSAAARVGPAEPPPFTASVGVPALHRAAARAWVALEALTPATPAIEQDTPRTIDDLMRLEARDEAAEFTAMAPPARPAPTPEQEQLDAIARDCLEEIGSMSLLRRPHADGDWLDALRFEDRALANLDALVALGAREPGSGAAGRAAPLIDVTDRVVAYGNELRAGDVGRAFTLSFVLGCFEGEAAARAAVSATRRAHPSTLAGHADALRLASGDAIGRATSALLLDARAELVEVGLDVLAARREASFASIVSHLSHPSPRVVAAAVRCLTTVNERAAAVSALEETLEIADDDRVFIASVEALAVLGSFTGLSALRDRLAVEAETRGLEAEWFVERGVEILATVGASTDVEIVRALGKRTWRLRRALGWFGHAAYVDLLLADLDALSATRASTRVPAPAEVATVEALHRIVGAELRVAPEQVPATEVTTSLVRDPIAWADAWALLRDRVPKAGRVRFGRPWSALASIDELARPALPGDRVHAARELATATAGASRLDVDGWVDAQLRELARLRAAFEAGTFAPRTGGWLADKR